MFEQIESNKRKSVFLVVFMAALLFGIGYFGGEAYMGSGMTGLVAAAIIWIILTLIAYNSGDSIFLSISGARKIKEDDHPILWNVVEEMKVASGLMKMPDVYIIDDPTPNAFATGKKPDKASVAVTAGLLETLNRSELQAVIAHELGHVKNRDVLFMMMIGVMMGAIVLIADFGRRWMFWGGMGRSRTSSREGGGQGQAIAMVIALVLMIIAPIIAQIIYFAISRKREYLADASAAMFTRYPEALASALEKISSKPQKLKNVSKVVAPSYILDPTLGAQAAKKTKTNIFSTHPPISQRIKILRAMTGGAGLADYDQAFRQVLGQPVGVIPFKTLESSESLSKKAPEVDNRSRTDRKRQTTDMFWKMGNFQFINCDCGTKLKIPPTLLGQLVMCPHCGNKHQTKK